MYSILLVMALNGADPVIQPDVNSYSLVRYGNHAPGQVLNPHTAANQIRPR